MDVTLAQLGDRRMSVDRSVLDQGWAFDGAPPGRSRLLWWADDREAGRPFVANVVVGFVDEPGAPRAEDRIDLDSETALLAASIGAVTPAGVVEERLTLGLLGSTPLVQLVRVYGPVTDGVPTLRALATIPVDVLDGVDRRVTRLFDALEVRS